MLFAVHDDDDAKTVSRRRVEALFEHAAAHEETPEDGYLLALAALRLAIERWPLVLPPYLEAEVERRREELEPFVDRAGELVERVEGLRDLRHEAG
jgi:hypothetical protein